MVGKDQFTATKPWQMRAALLHPAWLLLVTLLGFSGQIAFMSPAHPAIVPAAVCSLVLMWIVLGWSCGIYRVAREASTRSKIEIGPDRSWAFGLSAITLLVMPAALLDLSPGLGGIRDLIGSVGLLTLFGSLWLTAAALVTAEGHPVRYPTNRAIGTFLLIVYWIIGAWFLRPRILALRERASAEGQGSPAP